MSFIVGLSISGQTFYTFVLENIDKFAALKAMGANKPRTYYDDPLASRLYRTHRLRPGRGAVLIHDHDGEDAACLRFASQMSVVRSRVRAVHGRGDCGCVELLWHPPRSGTSNHSRFSEVDMSTIAIQANRSRQMVRRRRCQDRCIAQRKS